MALVVIVTGCADLTPLDDDATDTLETVPSPAGSPLGTTDPIPTIPPTAIPPTVASPTISIADRSHAEAMIQAFWHEKAPEVGLDAFRPLTDDRIVAVEDSDDVVVCDGERLPFGIIEHNAMVVPCAEGTTVVFDVALFAELTARFGPAAQAVVLAHEWGHVVQFQAGISSTPVIVEQQADCFAGAWVAWATGHDLDPFDDPSTLDSVLAAVVDFRDEPGLSAANSQAHGSGFDRVRAFQEGFEQGVGFCATYPDTPPSLVQLPFGPDEILTGGNLPLDRAVELMSVDLDRFFSELVPGLDPVDPRSVADAGDLTSTHREIGDNGVGLLLALGWGEIAQRAAGEETDGGGPLLQRACLAGAWMGELLDPPPSAEIRLSPGDLDEAILTFIERSGQAGTGEGLLVFDLVGNLRLGVTGGRSSCGLAR